MPALNAAERRLEAEAEEMTRKVMAAKDLAMRASLDAADAKRLERTEAALLSNAGAKVESVGARHPVPLQPRSKVIPAALISNAC